MNGMPRTVSQISGAIAYGFGFVVMLPLALALWAWALDSRIGLPALRSAPVGGALIAGGVLFMLAATVALWRRGGGLPMSPYAPSQRVTSGPFRIVANPVYAGFLAVCAGASLVAGSAAGLFVIAPVMALAIVAFVLGHESEATAARLGSPHETLLRLPADTPERPGWQDRLSVYALVLVPWLLLYGTVIHLGSAPDAVSTYTRLDDLIPVLPWTEILYAATYLFVAMVPLIARSRADLRTFCLRGWGAMAIVGSMHLLLPFVAPPKPVPGDGFLSDLMRFERALDSPVAAFPAFHVVWALIAAESWGAVFPRLRAAFRLLAIAIAASCLTTGMHSIADVVAGFITFFILLSGQSLFRAVRTLTERTANGWKEWTFGPVRVLNHGFFTGAAILIGLPIVTVLAGDSRLASIAAVSAGGVLGAALFAQVLEGSSGLLRPFGYYGAVIGVIAAALASPLWGEDGVVILAAFSVAAPLMHAIGRGRCLIQGCCHGRPAPDWLGIRYRHERSRVVRLAKLGGVPIHPTPLYSLLWSLLSFAVLLRLWTLGQSAEMLAGAYLLSAGLGRFVEESYRGEPQTRTLWGLRVYQWLAVLSVVGGAALTVAGPTPMPPAAPLSVEAAVMALGMALFTTAAYGMDLPRAGFRFSRLT
jgi:prolipoprotein diacylglyceryltransferase/protein-S-isoprenylcysteine O-methyltransferase Ste14